MSPMEYFNSVEHIPCLYISVSNDNKTLWAIALTHEIEHVKFNL